MKVLHLFFAVCVLAVTAQRRPSKLDTDFEATLHKSVGRSRGRTRFSLTPEFEQAHEEYKSVQKTVEVAPRRKTENVQYTERKPLRPAQDSNHNRRSYEVREVIDDIPGETIPKLKKKSHVVTETKFEATSNLKKDLSIPSPVPVEDLGTLSSTSGQMLSVEMYTDKTTEEAVMLSSEPPKIETEIKRKMPDRHTSRIRNNVPQKIEEPTRTRTRSKMVHRQEQRSSTVSPITPRNQVRVNRRRPQIASEIRYNSLRMKGPSVFSAEASAEMPIRSRPGRRVPLNANRVSEHVSEDPNPSNGIPLRRRLVERKKLPSVGQEVSESPRRAQIHKVEEPPKEDQSALDVPKVKVDVEENTTINNQRRGSGSLRQTVRATAEPVRNVASAPKRVDVRRGKTTDSSVTTPSLRRNGTIREILPGSATQHVRSKSRVKPVVENVETVVTNPTRGVWSRRRQSSGSIDDIVAASTRQTEVKIKIDSLHDDTQNVKVSLEKSFSVETKPGRIRKRPSYSGTTNKSNQIHGSNSDVSDQPSKIPLFNLRTSNDGEERGPRVSTQVSRPRGRTSAKKINADGLSHSQEVIDESDNYPSSFKAALKAKKKEGLLGSRTHNVNEASITKTTETTVTSSIPSTSLKTFPYAAAAAPSVVNKNEETPSSSSSRYPRPRFSLTSKQPKLDDAKETRKFSPKYPSSTTPHNENTQKFHARYKSLRTQTTEDASVPEKPLIKPRTYVPKPPKGIYSSRKFTRTSTIAPEAINEVSSKFSLEPASLSTKVPSFGLSAKNRFSARYRNEILPKSVVHRGSTTTPSYIPTVPTITPSSSTIKIEDRIQGLEVISIYDQVSNTLPSANLVSDASLQSEDSKNTITAQTEKTMSFIERIINSITAISTTTSPDSSPTQTTSTGQTTKNSAILNLVSKRPNLDPAELRQTLSDLDYKTTEKPTTIIEQILSSLSAIRADSATESTASNTMQVGSSEVTTTTTAPLTGISMTTPMFNTEKISSLSDGIITSTASVSSTALFTDTTSTIVSIEELNTIPTRAKSLQSRFLPETTSTLNPIRTVDKLLSLLNTTVSEFTTKLILVTPRSSTFLRSNTKSVGEETTPMLFTSEIEEALSTTNVIDQSSQTPDTTLPSSTVETIPSTVSISETPTTQPDLQSSTTPESSMVITKSSESKTSSTPTIMQPVAGAYPASLSISEQSANTSTVIASASKLSVVEALSTITPFTMTAQSSASAVQTGPYAPSVNTTASSNELTNTSDATSTTEAAEISTLTTLSTPNTSELATVTESYLASLSLSTNTANVASTLIETSSTTTTNFPTLSTLASQTTETEVTSTKSSLTTENTINDSATTLSVDTTTSSLFPYPGITTENDVIAQSSTISEVTVRHTTPPTTTDSVSSISINPEGASAVPTLSRFEVSPDRVTIYSPNDISSTFIPDETTSTSVSITARALTTDPTITITTTTKPYPNSQPTTTTIKTTTNTIDETTKDVSSNTINTNSVTDKPDVSNIINPLSASTNATDAMPPSSGTSTNKPIMMEVTNRDGKRLTFELMNPPNAISNLDESQRDYFIFAVLQNNTILRKRPSRFPNKKIPFLIYGLLPNNTLVQKFPNGTIVPMEPVIQVNGFDTRENPPPPPELISNPVTGIEDSKRSNKQLTVDVEDRLEANQLAIDSQTGARSNLPPVVELLGGKTINAFNDIVNKTQEDQSNKIQTLDVDLLVGARFGNNVDTTTISTKSTETSTVRLTTTPAMSTPTTTVSTTGTTTTSLASTTTTTAVPTTATTTATLTTTSAPQITTTPVATITSPPTSVTTQTETPSTTKLTTDTSSPEPILFTSPLSLIDIDINANALAIGVSPSSTSIQPHMTLLELLTTGASTPRATTLKVPSLRELEVNEDSLSEQQKQDLAILRSLEKEQEAILKQLAFLTGLNLRGTNIPGENSLTNRVIAQAVEKSKTGTSDEAKNVAASTVNDLIKQINTVTPTSAAVSSTYGKTNDALLASLLKEYGVGPTTPEGFSDVFTKELLTTTKAPTRKTTTQSPGPLMQGLSWLLNTLSPQPSPKPKLKPKLVVKTTTATTTTTPTPTPKSELINQATTVIPVIARFDEPQPKNAVITDKQLEALIIQLEAIQKDPKKAKNLDIQSFKNLQNLERLKVNNDLSIISSTKTPVTNFELKPLIINRGHTGQSSTSLPLSITNNIEDTETTAKLTPTSVINEPTRSRIPPVKLNPVPGVPDEGPRIRGQLVNYAINITKAISSFLGSALQDASNQFVTILSNSSENASQLFSSNYSGNV